MRNLLLLTSSVLLLPGCAAGLAFQARGVGFAGLYADNTTAYMVTENAVGSKMGESCASSILGLVTTGDASIASAAKKGGITRVGSVDQSFTNILGIYSTLCVQVSGE